VLRRELVDALTALSGGDLAQRAEASSSLVKAINTATDSLAERLGPVRDEAREANEAALVVFEHVLGTSEEDGKDRGRLSALHTELTVRLDATRSRMTELPHLAKRLGEIGGQAQAAALNVAIEVSRDGSASQDTLTVFADEVRRFAERTEAIAQRVNIVVEKAQSAHRDVLATIEGLSAYDAAVVGSARRLKHALREISRQLEERLSLPSQRRRDQRVEALRERLDVELDRLAMDPVTSAEIDDALDQLERLLRGPLGRRASDDSSEQGGAS
jgi:methyl-accepting chemotaxis protein